MSIESGLMKTVVNIEDGKHRLINLSATKHILLLFPSSFYNGKTNKTVWLDFHMPRLQNDLFCVWVYCIHWPINTAWIKDHGDLWLVGIVFGPEGKSAKCILDGGRAGMQGLDRHLVWACNERDLRLSCKDLLFLFCVCWFVLEQVKWELLKQLLKNKLDLSHRVFAVNSLLILGIYIKSREVVCMMNESKKPPNL